MNAKDPDEAEVDSRDKTARIEITIDEGEESRATDGDNRCRTSAAEVLHRSLMSVTTRRYNKRCLVILTSSSGIAGRPRCRVGYKFAADSFHTKKLCSRLSSSEVRL